MRFFVPFGTDEAYFKLTLEGGASVSFLTLTVNDKPSEPVKLCGVADGGLSAYAPKNTAPAVLAAVKAGFNAVVFDLEQSRDGVIVATTDPIYARIPDGADSSKVAITIRLNRWTRARFPTSFIRERAFSRLKMRSRCARITPLRPISVCTAKNSDSKILKMRSARRGKAIITSLRTAKETPAK